jgi:hemerythrin superfamily protein
LKKKIKNERKKDGEDDKDDDDGKSPDQMNKRTEAIMNQLLEMNESEEDLVF